MTKQTLTDRTLKSLKPNEKPYDRWDSVVRGLGIRVMGSGVKTFVLATRFPGGGKYTRRSLGGYGELTLEQARDKARDWLALIRKGVDPQVDEERRKREQLRRQENTFLAVCEEFIRDKLPSERKGREVERDLRRELIPVWGPRPITEIAPYDVRQIVKVVKDRGTPYQAHNILGHVKRLFGWAIDQQAFGIETSPCDRLKPKAIIGKKKPRQRILFDPELRAFWKAAGGLGYPYGPLFQLLALTGQRKSVVAEAQWSEFDLKQKLWTVPAERMKADAAHVVPLPDDAIVVLESLPRFRKGEHLFSTTFGTKPVNGFSKAKVRLDRVMLSELRKNSDDPEKVTLAPFVLHDVRRTMRTGLSALPVPDLVRELVIAHTKPGLHKVYDQYAYVSEKRHALELWVARLRTIVDPLPDNVVSITARG
jgi:integrase